MTDSHPPDREGLAGLAWQAFTAGDASRATSLAAGAAAARPAARWDRQRAQIVQLAIAGEIDRAFGLGAEHLAEFPGDRLIRQVHEWAARRRPRA
jgi:hypothetical protein